MNKIDIIIGKTLKEKRILEGLSQEALGDAVGVSFQQIQKYERGVNRISASRLVELSEALHCEVADLFGDLKAGVVVTAPRSSSALRRQHKLIGDYNTLPADVQTVVANLVDVLCTHSGAPLLAVSGGIHGGN